MISIPDYFDLIKRLLFGSQASFEIQPFNVIFMTYRSKWESISMESPPLCLYSLKSVSVTSRTSSLALIGSPGVPIIRFAQKHGATNLLNLSTVATFFSAVTATTMQFSYQLGNDSLAISVNCFWFASLVFSTAAAVNSLLGLTWKQAM